MEILSRIGSARCVDRISDSGRWFANYFSMEQVQRRTLSRIAAVRIHKDEAGSYAGEDAGDRACAKEQAAAQQGADDVLRRVASWFGCYLVWSGPYPSVGAGKVQGAGNGAEDEGDGGGGASERVMVRHLRGRTPPKCAQIVCATDVCIGL